MRRRKPRPVDPACVCPDLWDHDDARQYDLSWMDPPGDEDEGEAEAQQADYADYEQTVPPGDLAEWTPADRCEDCGELLSSSHAHCPRCGGEVLPF